MKKVFSRSFYTCIIAALAFTACKKEILQDPPGKPIEQPIPVPVDTIETIKIKVQAVITVGDITYDSIPALFRITSWDSNDVRHQKDFVLAPGVNVIGLPKKHTRFEISIDKWGITDAISLNKNDLKSDTVYKLGGSKTPKKLHKEETFLFVMDTYQPSSRIYYQYQEKGLSEVSFFQKKPESTELQFTRKNLYKYTGDHVARIDVFDASNANTGFTEFTYDDQDSRITHMHQKSYDVETYAAVEHNVHSGAGDITIDFLYNNGHALTYNMKMVGGNKVEDRASSSTGGGEGGTYEYDFNINPFAHMKMPNMFLSNLSKNNIVDQQKNHSGNIPSAVIYKYEYIYDNEGYPKEVVKFYKSYMTGAHLYKIKTIYTYKEEGQSN